jgi:transcription antitermination factor NusB
MLALQALCVLDAMGDAFVPHLDGFFGDPEVHADLSLAKAPPPGVRAFARRLTEGTWRLRQRCDELLSAAATSWSIDRMSPADRNILRLGLYELLEVPETPPEVVIDEAINLARRFADHDSPAFVNGVLDAVWQKLKAGRADDGARPEEPAGTG